jgi:hypothetical protein
MLPDCKLVRFLKALQDSSDEKGAVGLSFVARSALNIVKDIVDESMTEKDIACLADLVSEICNEGYTGLLIYLKEDSPDCPICTALIGRLHLSD